VAHVAMIVSNRYDPDPRVAKEAHSLVDAGHRVTVIAFDRGRELAGEEIDGRGVRIRRSRVAATPYGTTFRTAAGLALFKLQAGRMLLEDPPDAVHCHDQDTCSVGLWWKTVGARMAGKRGLFVFDAHDLYWTWVLMEDPGSPWRRGVAKFLEGQCRLFANAADMVITVTDAACKREGTAQVFREWGVEPVVIWNAPYRPAEVPSLPKRPTVGYLGKVREPEMFAWLAEAMARVAPTERPGLLVAGDGVAREAVAAMLERAARELDFPLEVKGAFSMEEMPSLMARTSCQFCLYPTGRGNIDRAMPVKLLESVAYGRPVIGNARSLMGEWISDRGWGWVVEEGSVDGLAKALSAVYRLGPAGMKIDAGGVPTWEEQGRRLARAYDSLEV